jgi:hypothetical protein
MAIHQLCDNRPHARTKAKPERGEHQMRCGKVGSRARSYDVCYCKVEKSEVRSLVETGVRTRGHSGTIGLEPAP